MVMFLKRPDYEDVNLIDSVVKERQNGVNRDYFTNVSPIWKRRVRDYIDHCGNPEIIKPWGQVADDAIKTRFLTLYGNPADDSVQKPILEHLRERTLQICPACGEDGTPNTLDHYLPKNHYPEFSITTVNLFPMCDICQGWKGVKTVNDTGKRLFLHPYFDKFLERQVVSLEIGAPYNAPRAISLGAHPDLPPALQLIVSRHMKELEMVSRYYHFFREQYIRLLGSASDIREEGLDMRQQIGLFRRTARRKSINSWGHIFYDAVLCNEDLLEYLETSDLLISDAWIQ
ncbi:hypothetical protein P608_10320 [Comamonas thiooxydans]|uniref:HNH endonuclease n=1 Tax=Comamonas thiooxydans TaxID=363952 RepID=A0A0E3CGT7_9BURK|nr:hypothetical protein [Comamonas thiooxydans]KGH12736.1 hypothetical protein P608_10320 [Comamonas thiooxydans]KGH13785.1 hypothetical protein P607_23915 [Comamonas thiooxydans]